MREPQVRKESIVKRFASVTFDGALASCEREDAARVLGSLGVTPTSWASAAGRTYVSATLAADVDLPRVREALVARAARIDAPALAVWRVVPRFADRVANVHQALGGPGAPTGVLEVLHDGDAVVVAFHPQATAASLVVALVDAASGGAAARRIEPLVALDDATLARLASAMLREPALDATRLIETHLAAVLA